MSLLSDISALQDQKDKASRHWWETAMNEASVNGIGAQSVMNEAKDALQQQNEIARDVQAVGGGSDASVAAMQERANQQYVQGLRSLAGNLAAQRNQVNSSYLAMQQQALQERIARKQQQVNNIAQAASGVVQSGLGLIGTAVGGPVGGAVGAAVGGAVASAARPAINQAFDTVAGQMQQASIANPPKPVNSINI